MDETKNPDDPPSYRNSQSFKQNYAGTSITKTHQGEHTAINQTQQAHDAERKPIPVEMKRCIAWARRNHNAIIAFSSVGILVVTTLYAVFAYLQWSTMQDQLTDYESGQRAIIEVVDTGWDSKTETLSYTLKNIGHSTALNINIETIGGEGPPNGETRPTWNCPPPEYMELNVRHVPPASAGFPLTEGDTKPFSQSLKVGEETRSGRNFNRVFINVGFADVFGKTGEAYAALSYDARLSHQTFKRCYLQVQQ